MSGRGLKRIQRTVPRSSSETFDQCCDDSAKKASYLQAWREVQLPRSSRSGRTYSACAELHVPGGTSLGEPQDCTEVRLEATNDRL
jgi:hypothetical protein